MEDLARMELERGECLSPMCNKETREGLSQCIGTTRPASAVVRPLSGWDLVQARINIVVEMTRPTTGPARLSGKDPEPNLRVSGVPDNIISSRNCLSTNRGNSADLPNPPLTRPRETNGNLHSIHHPTHVDECSRRGYFYNLHL